MSFRIRRNVYRLPETDETLVWYRRAVELMMSRPITDPTSWNFMAAVHGNPFGQTPPAAAPFWNQCQHQSWYFLPWHRTYITAFEAMVAEAVESLGGPADWALPYWDYSEDLSINPEARRMPPAFRDRTLPNGDQNFLWSRRFQVTGGDFGLSDFDVDLGALDEAEFTPAFGPGAGFGGLPTAFNAFGGTSGALEMTPHNAIHNRIGGFMRNPATAAFDPIFWLHHCNIDRLWEEWRKRDVNHQNPSDPNWLRNVRFDMHDGAGQPFAFTAEETVDTTNVLHGYLYDTIPTPPAAPAGGTEMVAMDEGEPELAGTSEGAVRLEGETTSARVVMRPDMAGKSFVEDALPTPLRVFLSLENVRGAGEPADFRILVDLEDDAEPPLQVGLLTTFGLAQASDPRAPHGGIGVTQVFDITRAADRLQLTTDAAPKLRVTFERVAEGAQPEGVPPGLEELVPETTEEPRVEVGRIGVFFR